MAFPIPVNTTCDIYRAGTAPPSDAPALTTSGALTPAPRNCKVGPSGPAYTHWLDLPLDTDIRDSPADAVYVPDRNGTMFAVCIYERIRCGGGNDFKRVYLMRQAVSWPSQDL
jgi:hypothetical protein